MKEKSANDIVTIEKLFKLFELMQKEHVTAWNILLHSSYLGTNSIPVEILTSLFDKTVIDTKIELGFWVLMQQEQSENKIKLTESILEALNKYYPPNDRGYTQEIEIYKNLIKALDTIFPEINKEQEKEWEKAKILYTYAEKILKDCENKKLLITNTELANLYNKLAAYNQFIKHDLQQSYQYYEKVLEINKAFNSSHELKLQDLAFDRLIATARYNAGIIGVELYPYKAQDYLKSYIKPAYEVKKSLNPNHPDIAAYLESIEIIKGKIKQLEQDQNISPLESAIVDYNQGIAYLNKAEEQNDNTLKKSSLHLALPFLEQGFKKFCKMHKDIDIEGQYIFKALYDIGRVYYDLGDQNKSLELFIEAYITRGKYKGAYENELKTYFSKMDSQDAGKLLNSCFYKHPSQMKYFTIYSASKIIQTLLEESDDRLVIIHPKLKKSSLELAQEHIKNDYGASKFIKAYLSLAPLKDYLNKHVPEFIKNGGTRELILERGSTDSSILKVKEKLQPEVLNKIAELASIGRWSFKSILNNWGVKGYLEEQYLQKILGNLYNNWTLEIAQMLCFEATCLGAMKSKDYNCVQKFVHEYPWLFQKIIDHHPEYLIDRSIVNLVALDKEKLWFGNSPHQPINIICQNNYTSESLKEEGWVILGEDATGNY